MSSVTHFVANTYGGAKPNYYFAGEAAQYCDEYVSLCVSVCLSARILYAKITN